MPGVIPTTARSPPGLRPGEARAGPDVLGAADSMARCTQPFCW